MAGATPAEAHQLALRRATAGAAPPPPHALLCPEGEADGEAGSAAPSPPSPRRRAPPPLGQPQTRTAFLDGAHERRYAEAWAATLRAAAAVGISQPELIGVQSLLAAVLHLGDIRFVECVGEVGEVGEVGFNSIRRGSLTTAGASP